MSQRVQYDDGSMRSRVMNEWGHRRVFAGLAHWDQLPGQGDLPRRPYIFEIKGHMVKVEVLQDISAGAKIESVEPLYRRAVVDCRRAGDMPAGGRWRRPTGVHRLDTGMSPAWRSQVERDEGQVVDGEIEAAGPGYPSDLASGREFVEPSGRGAAVAVAGQHAVQRRAKRRASSLSEIDAEIRTVEGDFANVIYLATER
jgi:hypothetical protein